MNPHDKQIQREGMLPDDPDDPLVLRTALELELAYVQARLQQNARDRAVAVSCLRMLRAYFKDHGLVWPDSFSEPIVKYDAEIRAVLDKRNGDIPMRCRE